MRRKGDLQQPIFASHGPVLRTLTVGVSGTLWECCSSQVRLPKMLILSKLLELVETCNTQPVVRENRQFPSAQRYCKSLVLERMKAQS
jgi:hypothetical protein